MELLSRNAFLRAALLAGFGGKPKRDLAYFLRRLRSLDHLPELERSHTAMASTWDRTGGNRDGVDFKQIAGNVNTLLEVAGPGCVHRIFTGRLGRPVEGTRLQLFLDGGPQPLIDLPVNTFFDDKNGPLAYPLVFHKTYPGTLFPIPFAKRCRVRLVNEGGRNWGNFWQLTYTVYAPGTPVESLRWPLREAEQAEMKAVAEHWLRAEAAAPALSAGGWEERRFEVRPGRSVEHAFAGSGVVRQLRVRAEPDTPEVLRGLRMQAYWDGYGEASIDAPVGYFFGHADSGHAPDARFASLLLGVTDSEAYTCLPMPFARGARFEFRNQLKDRTVSLLLRLECEHLRGRASLPPEWGRLHATWTEEQLTHEREDIRRAGPAGHPVHTVLDRQDGPGKYVGTLLHVGWPDAAWWGEGDWLIWTDEDAWPPSYHGTGSEEYFNSGWCQFDRKAVSGIVRGRREREEAAGLVGRPGDVVVYSFHLNDAFQFQEKFRIMEEIWPHSWPGEAKPATGIRPGYRRFFSGPCDSTVIWGSTAFWYALPARPAGSRVEPIQPRHAGRLWEQIRR